MNIEINISSNLRSCAKMHSSWFGSTVSTTCSILLWTSVIWYIWFSTFGSVSIRYGSHKEEILAAREIEVETPKISNEKLDWNDCNRHLNIQAG